MSQLRILAQQLSHLHSRTTTVQMPNLALIETKRIIVHAHCTHTHNYKCASNQVPELYCMAPLLILSQHQQKTLKYCGHVRTEMIIIQT